MTDRREPAGYSSTSIAVRIVLFLASLVFAVLSGLAMSLAVNEGPMAGLNRLAPSPAAIKRLTASMRPALPAAAPQPAPAPLPAAAPPAPPAPPAGPASTASVPDAPPAMARTPAPAPAPPALAAPRPDLRSGTGPVSGAAPPALATRGADAPLAMPAGGPFVAQVGAYPTVAMAQESWSALAAAYPALAGIAPQLNPITRDGRIIYRSQVPGFASKAGALSFCRTLRAAGRDCFVPAESDSPAAREANP